MLDGMLCNHLFLVCCGDIDVDAGCAVIRGWVAFGSQPAMLDWPPARTALGQPQLWISGMSSPCQST
jgi:hypothetical protein